MSPPFSTTRGEREDAAVEGGGGATAGSTEVDAGADAGADALDEGGDGASATGAVQLCPIGVDFRSLGNEPLGPGIRRVRICAGLRGDKRPIPRKRLVRTSGQAGFGPRRRADPGKRKAAVALFPHHEQNARVED